MIYGLIKTYRFPAPYKIGPKIARWSEKELLAWITDVKDGKLAAQEGAFE
ncbi:helix-turn-helix transcriptional regulator [Novosphingobium terrae]|nr:AlpA family phage regulatory protein [Novosphingobium terrae]